MDQRLRFSIQQDIISQAKQDGEQEGRAGANAQSVVCYEDGIVVFEQNTRQYFLVGI